MPFRPPMHDLIVIGGSAAGLSVAKRATLAGLSRVIVLEPTSAVSVPRVVDEFGLDVHHETPVVGIDIESDECRVRTEELTYSGRVCVLAPTNSVGRSECDADPRDRIHSDVGEWLSAGTDIVLVGDGHQVVEMTERVVAGGAFATVCLPRVGHSRLSEVSLTALRRLELARRAVLIRGADPVSLDDCGEGVRVRFSSTDIPAQLFDGVVYPVQPPELAALDPSLEVVVAEGVTANDRLYSVTDTADVVSALPAAAIVASAADIWDDIAARHFRNVLRDQPRAVRLSSIDGAAVTSLRRDAYNATVEDIALVGESVVIRVRPDVTDDRRRIGTVASVGVGSWEMPASDADAVVDVRRVDQLLRCARHVGVRIFDDDGYLTDPRSAGEMVLRFAPDEPDESVAGVYGRLLGMTRGHRIFVGPTVRSGLSAAAVRDPMQDIVMIAGDMAAAAQDAALVDLIRRGHRGGLHAVVIGPRGSDLADSAADSLSHRYDNVARTIIEAPRSEWATAIAGAIENLVRYTALDSASGVIFTMGLHEDIAVGLQHRTDQLGFATAPGQQSDVAVDLSALDELLSTR